MTAFFIYLSDVELFAKITESADQAPLLTPLDVHL